MKRLLTYFGKVLLSGLLSFVCLTLFCMLYRNIPVHSSTVSGATDYAWEYDKFYSRATEGFAWGKTNNEGYLNTFDYYEDMDIDILVMGSSHMEAYQVAMDESASAVLGKLLPDRTVYNIGVSGHDFLVCADNLAAAINTYNPSEYVLMETSNLQFTDEKLLAAINENIPDLQSHNSGIIGFLQKNQFLRTVYSQLKEFSDDSMDSEEMNESGESVEKNRTEEWNYDLYRELLVKMANTVSQSGAQLIIVYQPALYLNEDGSASVSNNKELAAFFSDTCKSNGILFLDMSDRFLRNYMENAVLPHGFSNSSVGSGHLNKYGHEMIAHAVCTIIKGEE